MRPVVLLAGHVYSGFSFSSTVPVCSFFYGPGSIAAVDLPLRRHRPRVRFVRCIEALLYVRNFDEQGERSKVKTFNVCFCLFLVTMNIIILFQALLSFHCHLQEKLYFPFLLFGIHENFEWK